MNPLLLTDGYKLDHRRQYPEGTNLVFSNWTPRKSRIENVHYVVLFGLQYLIKKYLIDDFDRYFFSRPKHEVVAEYEWKINQYLGANNIGSDHIAALHDLGYLPISIWSIPEGRSVPVRVPMFCLYNTNPDFFWLTNYLETLISAVLWMPCTSATISKEYRRILDSYAEETSSQPGFVDWQGHDFSMRGMAGESAFLTSAAGHLLSFSGTDTLPSLSFIGEYYPPKDPSTIIGSSVPATEHSVMCMGTMEDEIGTFRRLITEVYPSGVIAIVSDTWNLWDVLAKYLPILKDDILARDGKVVIRPDSGDPVNIICGYEIPSYLGDNATSTDYYNHMSNGMDGNGKKDNIHEFKGVIELLWDAFGGSINDKGYKELDPHIGAIYGDSITIERAREICERLKSKGFASTNVVLGIGSFTYQFNTRDTLGFAVKSTYGEVNGVGREIFKDPITDDGTKKSAKGLIRLEEIDGEYKMVDQTNWDDFARKNAMKPIFANGKLLKDYSLEEIRENVKK